MKLSTKLIVGIGIIVIAIISFIVVEQRMTIDDENSSETSLQTDANYVKVNENSDTEEDGNESIGSDRDPSEIDASNGKITSVGETSETEVLPNTEVAGGEASIIPSKEAVSAPPTEIQSGGLYFSTREEAIAFGFSRFTAEEVAIYNRVSENGLTPEQQEMAIQMAYSRFSAEEIAAIEQALGR